MAEHGMRNEVGRGRAWRFGWTGSRPCAFGLSTRSCVQIRMDGGSGDGCWGELHWKGALTDTAVGGWRGMCRQAL
eukprot:366438-Chlamydomonas_euryale.AAC.22